MQHNLAFVGLQGLLSVDVSTQTVSLLASRITNASLARADADIMFCDDVDVGPSSGLIYFTGTLSSSWPHNSTYRSLAGWKMVALMELLRFQFCRCQPHPTSARRQRGV
jgi:hypothetical protein